MLIKILSKVLSLGFVFALLAVQANVQAKSQAGNPPALDVCRFGITSVLDPAGYPLDAIGVGGFLDWQADALPGLPAGVAYLRVLRVSDSLIADTQSHLSAWLTAHPGAIWVVGNEPDTSYGGQDNLLPEDYAQRFFTIASQIRSSDPGAQIAFGTIVQPTPIRLRYLNRAWTELVRLAGSAANASSLIDIWAIHSFMLNEEPAQWGTGVPKGFENDYGDAYITNDISTTYSIALFSQRIANFRQWMLAKGEQNKPLWITEYGSLIPPTYVGWATETVPDETTADFMTATFDYLLTATDPSSGLASDGQRLVQRWFWYSLNGHRYDFGGTLFDPDGNRAVTPVGIRFIDYLPPAGVTTDVQVLPGHAVLPLVYAANGNVDYVITVQLGTVLGANAPSRARVSLYEDQALVAGPVTTGVIRRCGGVQSVSLWWKNIIPSTAHHLEVRVETLDRADTNPANNTAVLDLSAAELGTPQPGFPQFSIFLPDLSK